MMTWQDIVISSANILFSYSLIFQAYHGFKKKKGFLTIQTSLLTTIGLYAITCAFFSLNLFFSAISSFFSGTLWFILFWQKVVYGGE